MSREKIVQEPTADAIYLTQWTDVGSSPQMVFYDRAANLNLFAGEEAEAEKLKVVTAKARKVDMRWILSTVSTK